MSAAVLVVKVPKDFRFQESDFGKEYEGEIESFEDPNWINGMNALLDQLLENGMIEKDDGYPYFGMFYNEFPKDFVIKEVYFNGWTDGIILLKDEDIAKALQLRSKEYVREVVKELS